MSSDFLGLASACVEDWAWDWGLEMLIMGSLVTGWRGEAVNSPDILVVSMN